MSLRYGPNKFIFFLKNLKTCDFNPFKTDKTVANGNLRLCLGNHKQSVTRTYHQDQPRKVRVARQALDLRHSPQAPSQS